MKVLRSLMLPSQTTKISSMKRNHMAGLFLNSFSYASSISLSNFPINRLAKLTASPPFFSSQSYLFILKKYPPSFNQVNIFPGPSAHGFTCSNYLIEYLTNYFQEQISKILDIHLFTDKDKFQLQSIPFLLLPTISFIIR